MPCLLAFNMGQMKSLSQSQIAKYTQAWNDFERIQAINSNTSTVHSTYPASRITETYYTFISYAEKSSFTQGQFLHAQAYPNSNWNIVEEN